MQADPLDLTDKQNELPSHRRPPPPGIPGSYILVAVVTIAMMLLNAVLLFVGTREVFNSTHDVARAHEVLASSEHLLSTLADAETGQRGYIITGVPSYLEPFQAAKAEAQGSVGRLRALTSDNIEQDPAIQDLERLVNDKLDELSETIALRRDKGLEAARIVMLTDRGKRAMDTIRSRLKEINARESILLAAGEQKTQSIYELVMLGNALRLVLGLGILGFAFFIVYQDMAARSRAEKSLLDAKGYAEAIISDSPFGLYVVDADFRIAQMNIDAQKGAFINVRPVIGRRFDEAMHILWPEDVAAGIIKVFRQTQETGEPYYSKDFINPRRDKEQVEGYEWELHRIATPDGRYGVVCYYFDSTALRDAERRVRDSEEKLRSFAEQLEHRVTERTTELLQSQERLRAMAVELNLAEQRERRRLARELHDHLQQLLVLGKMKLGQGKQLAHQVPACATLMKEADEVLSEALTYTRTLVTDLSPRVLSDHGLAAGLLWLGNYMQRHDMAVTVRVPEQEVTLPEDQKTLLFQSVRELLINASKHAGTGKATVTLNQVDGTLRIDVRDDGVGFEPAAAAAAMPAPKGGISSKFGLFSIQERMRALGGFFALQSAPGKGTTATLVLPMARNPDAEPPPS